MPRSYSMQRRRVQAAETRQRIVDAAVSIHGEKGALRAKPAEIAARANVALPTYYKYFPSLGALVTACTARGRELAPPPELGVVSALPLDPFIRVPHAVRALFDYYEAREPWIYAGRTEERFIPEVRPVMERLRDFRNAFARAALALTRTEDAPPASIVALTDYWTWRTLRRDLNLSQEDAIAAATEAVLRIAGDAASRPRQKGGADDVSDR